MKTQARFFNKYPELSFLDNTLHLSHGWTKAILAFGDFCSMILSMLLALGAFKLMGIDWEGIETSILQLLLIVFVSTFVLVGYYRSRNVNQVDELRHLTITITIIFLALFSFNALLMESKYPPVLLGICWFLIVITVPLTRIFVRWIGSKIGIWGEPVVVVGNGSLSRKVVQYLIKNTYCGMKPVLVVDGFPHASPASASSDLPIPVTALGTWPSAPRFEPRMGIRTAIVVAPDLPSNIREAISRGEHFGFSNIITITDHFTTRNFGLTPLDFGGVLGFEERHYELNAHEDRLIRLFDWFLIMLALPLLAPLFLFIMIAIKLDSRGSIFYRQTRIGKNASIFKVLKFRTMVQDADKVLARYLEENPEMLAEWNADHKLRNDPRITRVGKFLRKASLDELPQLWNVLKGEMSLIGPRPIVNDEIKRYGDRFKYYTQVPPGLSGLWQVSGRNDTGYEERVSLDEYYVRNRSIWLNIHIIIRTILVVLNRNGAY